MSATTIIISQSAIRSPVSEFYRRFKRQRIAMVSLVVIVVLVITAFTAQWIAPYDQATPDARDQFSMADDLTRASDQHDQNV